MLRDEKTEGEALFTMNDVLALENMSRPSFGSRGRTDSGVSIEALDRGI